MLTNHHRSRRRFLILGGAALASAGFIGVARVRRATRRKKKKVIIVGAGLAGLNAAHRLERYGFEVNVLEARSRPGGRVFTIRDNSPGGLITEAGAARISSGHTRVLRLIQRLGLAVEPFYPDSGRLVVIGDGERVVTPDYKTISSDSFHRVITRRENWRALGEPAKRAWLQQWRAPAWMKVKGGSDLIPRGLASLIHGRIDYDAPVSKIARRGDRVDVLIGSEGSVTVESADAAVCTVPTSVMGEIAFEPLLSAMKRQAFTQIRYDPASRFFVKLKDENWKTPEMNGFAMSDHLSEVWYAAKDGNGILTAYFRHPISAQIMQIAAKDRVDYVQRQVAAIFPRVEKSISGITLHCWANDRWSRGSVAFLGPLNSELRPQLRAAEGRVHFAGEHTATNNTGWMDGALESGYRAAREIALTFS